MSDAGTNGEPRSSHRWWPAVLFGVCVLVFVRIRARVPVYVLCHHLLDGLGVPTWLRNLDGSLLMLLAAFGGAALVARPRTLAALGLRGPFCQGWRFGLIVALPMLFCAAMGGGELTLNWRVVKGSLLAALTEETLFRGLFVAIPVCIGRAPFWPTAIASSLLFGAVHVPWNSLLAWNHLFPFLITTVAGLWFAWLLRAFAWNLWTTIATHCAMNAAWLIFSVEGGAVGSGLWPILGRILTITLGMILALRQTLRQLPF